MAGDGDGARRHRAIPRPDQWEALPTQEKKVTTSQVIESSLYSKYNFASSINHGIDELAEIAHKAVANVETHSAKVAVFWMAKVAKYYLEARKDNLILLHGKSMEPFDSDVHDVLRPLYEHFKNINIKAVITRDEMTATNVINALGSIAIYTANLNAPNFPKHEAPITWFPIGYIQQSIETAQREGLDDVVLEGSWVLLDIAKKAPTNIQAQDIHLSVVNVLGVITTNFFLSGKRVLASKALENMMVLPYYLITENYFQSDIVMRRILDKLEDLIPLAIANGLPTIGLDIPSYDLEYAVSIGNLVRLTASNFQQKEDDMSFQQFIKLNKYIYWHFSNLVQKINLSSNLVLWHIMQTIKHILGIYLDVLKNTTLNSDKKKELTNQASWYLSSIGAAFSKQTPINFADVESACNVLSQTGMGYLNQGYPRVAEESASLIAYIASFYCKVKKEFRPYEIEELLMFIWPIRLLAVEKNDQAMVAKLDEKINTKPETLTEKEWLVVKKAIETRKYNYKRRKADWEE